MLPVVLLAFLAALLFVYSFMPSVWLAVMACDDSRDIVGVASKNPFRESGPPACMAKLIMMRHKIHQSHSRKRRVAAPPPLPQSLPSPRPRVHSPRIYPPSPSPAKPAFLPLPLPAQPPRPSLKRLPPPAKLKPIPTRSSWMGMPTRFSRAFGKQHH